jgi:hypothetical protein
LEYNGGESNVKKKQNGRKSLRRLKPTMSCNASRTIIIIRRRRRRKKEEAKKTDH